MKGEHRILYRNCVIVPTAVLIDDPCPFSLLSGPGREWNRSS